MSVVAVCAGKGSPGATFSAVNLAAATARRGMGTLLIDADASGGDVAAYLGLDPRRGLYPLLLTSAQPPDCGVLLGEAQEKAGMLATAGFPEALPAPDPAVLGHILRVGRESGRLVIADLGRISASCALVAAEADLVLLVVRPDVVSVFGAERALHCLEAAGVPRHRVFLMISGLERRRPGDLVEIAQALRLEVIGSIPIRRRAARAALRAQAPVARGALARAFGALSGSVLDRLFAPRAARDRAKEVASR